jgi:hypothetical protein
MPPPSQEQLRDLCRQILACTDDDHAIELAKQLRAAVHAYVEHVRTKLPPLPPPTKLPPGEFPLE